LPPGAVPDSIRWQYDIGETAVMLAASHPKETLDILIVLPI
jgi:hypothetical protein